MKFWTCLRCIKICGHFKDLKIQIVKICIICKRSCPFIINISSCLIKNIICQHVFYFADSNQFRFGINYTSYDFIIINLLRFGESRGSFCTLVTTKDGNLETRAHSVNIEELLRQETERHNQQVIREIWYPSNLLQDSISTCTYLHCVLFSKSCITYM